MESFYVRFQSEYIIFTDFGDKVFYPTEIIAERKNSDVYMVVSCKIIGKPEDFDSEEKRKAYLDKPIKIDYKDREKRK